MGIVESTNTERGRDFAGLVRQGCKVGFSLRAVGPVTERKGDTVIVKDPLTIFSYDWVIHPSHKCAYMTELMSEDAQLMIENLCESYNTDNFIPMYEEENIDEIISKNIKVVMDSVTFSESNDILLAENTMELYSTPTKKLDTTSFLNTHLNSYMRSFSEETNIMKRKRDSKDYDL